MNTVKNEHYFSREEASPDQLFKLFRSRPRSSASGKLKQTELASRILVDVRAIQQWENGERLPSAQNLKKLLAVFAEEGIFLSQREREEARLLWHSVSQAYHQRPGSTRVYPPFDEAWFDTVIAELHQDRLSPVSDASASHTTTTLEMAHTNLPRPLTSFVGRTHELAEIKQHLASARLLTLAGPGGCGKTRLALEAAHAQVRSYTDGIWFVDLSTVQESASLLEVVAMTLAVSEKPGQSLKDALEAVLRHKRMLLILDNCEQVIDACARTIEMWLQACPSLHILVTSRELLHVPGEQVFFVPPLAVPMLDHLDRDLSLSKIQSYASVRMFIERARVLLPSFGLTPENAQGIIEICQRLDGLPLALELAAARMNLLSVEQLVAHLSTPLSFLVQGSRTAPVQQQTLRASIDWSYHLLNEQEQALLQQVSVFAGGWTLNAMEAVCQLESTRSSEEQSTLLPLLASLVAKSLITVGRVSPGDEPRYYLLETIREYAQERLKERQREHGIGSPQERHAWYYVHFVEEIEPHLRSNQRSCWLQRLHPDYKNIRLTLSWCQTHQTGKEPGLCLVAALYWFWLHQGSWSEGRRWLDAMLHLTRMSTIGRDAAGTYAKAAHGAGLLAWVQGDESEAAMRATESVAEARQANAHIVLAACLRLSSLIAQQQGYDDQAQAQAEESIAHAQGNAWSRATSLNMLGTIMRMQGKRRQACAFYEESIVLLREVGDRWELSAPLRNLGNLLIQEGNDQRARVLYRESLLCCQEMKGQWFLSRSLEDMALLLSRQGNLLQAATILGAAEALREQLGATVLPFSTQTYEQCLDIIRQQLSSEEYRRSWQAGRAMNAEQAISYALAATE
jgi:predicted ATPase/transcriptional regulator with XRE-family HTH domain